MVSKTPSITKLYTSKRTTEVIEMVISYAKSISFGVRHLEFSPIKGPEGNIEYLVHLVRLPDGVTEEETNVDVDAVVKSAHDTLDK